ncbi:MAG: moaE1, partial [Mucilaginibacter sp.]|nr:moaE1 [Mucilaginibacter sp.]
MSPESGGIDIFIGTVRNATKGKPVIRLEFEAYEPMAIAEMEKIAKQASE